LGGAWVTCRKVYKRSGFSLFMHRMFWLGLILLAFWLVGCTPPESVGQDDQTEVDSYDHLQSYCVTYTEKGYRGSEKTEWCQDGRQSVHITEYLSDELALPFSGYCLDNQRKYVSCFDDHVGTVCHTDILDQSEPCVIEDGLVGLPISLSFYKEFSDPLASRKLAGVMALCFNLSNQQIDVRGGAICLHPENMMVLYKANDYTSYIVHSLTIPAPASKFKIPAKAEMTQ
jgi:hypothetical protein